MMSSICTVIVQYECESESGESPVANGRSALSLKLFFMIQFLM